ncbi:MAG: hypothetical protein GY749_08395 [Desulfobacteraceae bacterium]|nr:hypothetical protein [Desulfobacteraceae bacterium]
MATETGIIKGPGTINVSSSQVGVIGDHAKVKGGIHFVSNKRNIKIEFEGKDANKETSEAFNDWLVEEKIEGLHIENLNLPTLSIIINTSSVIDFIKSTHTWIRARRPNLSIKLKTKNSELKIDAQNPGNLQEIIKRASDVLKG